MFRSPETVPDCQTRQNGLRNQSWTLYCVLSVEDEGNWGTRSGIKSKQATQLPHESFSDATRAYCRLAFRSLVTPCVPLRFSPLRASNSFNRLPRYATFACSRHAEIHISSFNSVHGKSTCLEEPNVT
eukprot:6184665-Pleurochrysis_carterae.AAC.4